jgi:hypothetical protein
MIMRKTGLALDRRDGVPRELHFQNVGLGHDDKRTFWFAVSAMFLPVPNKKIPCSERREFVQRSLVFQWACEGGEGRFIGNSLYFPVDQGIWPVETRSRQPLSTAT